MRGARREFHPLQFGRPPRRCRRRVDVVTVIVERGHHRRVAQRVDQARHAAGVAEDLGKVSSAKISPAVRAGHFQPMPDVGAQVARCDSAPR